MAASKNYTIYGVVLTVAGIVLLLFGGASVSGALSAGLLETGIAIVLGLALLIVGCGAIGYAWSGGWPNPELSPSAKWSVIATFVTTSAIAVLALWAYAAGNGIWTAVAVGALGGLVHEIAQSKGTAFLPGTSSTAPKGTGSGSVGGAAAANAAGGTTNPPTGASASGESYLGGLLGIILGGAAGLLILSTTSGPTVNPQFVVTAFAAGIALKGISDAAASPTVTQSTTAANTAPKKQAENPAPADEKPA
jgi:hypothetical protein